MNVLHHSCLSMSYSSISSIITALADDSMRKARVVANGPHGFAYDNINISSSIYVEQAPNSMSKVQSGTFGVIYELLNARDADMQIEPMVNRLKNAGLLELSDLRTSPASMNAYATQTLVNICHILMKYFDGLNHLKDDPLFQHTVRRMIPPNHKTRYHPLRANTIEEASIEGNISVHNNFYIDQLDIDPDILSKFAIPSINDQLTNARIRGAQGIRKQDISAWERREIFQLAFGLFHLVMNLIWALLETHRGTLGQVGSLTHLFAVLEKTRLGGEKPDYHTLLASLTQIVEGLILNAWQTECGYSSLKDYAQSKPSAEDVLSLGRNIMLKYATPQLADHFKAADPTHPLEDLEVDDTMDMDNTSPDEHMEDEDDSESEGDDDDSSSSSSAASGSAQDTVHENILLLTRDLLYII